MIKVEANKIHEIQRLTFWVLSVAIGVLGLLYIYLTVASIVDVATRKRVEKDVNQMRGEAVALELSYIEKQNNITQNLAFSMGFVVPRAEFVSRSQGVAKVSLRNEN